MHCAMPAPSPGERLRRESRVVHEPTPRVSGAAGQCILSLCTILAVCVVIGRLLPGVQTERDPARFQVSPGVILIQSSPSPENSAPSISADVYRDWKSQRQLYFDAFAFQYFCDQPAAVNHAHVNFPF